MTTETERLIERHKRDHTEPAELDRVARAINQAWNSIKDVPFPLYQHEAEMLARAAIGAMRSADDKGDRTSP